MHICIIQGYYTLDMRCEFDEGSVQGDLQATSLQTESSDSNLIYCKCNGIRITGPGTLAEFRRTFQTAPNCTLSISRCPLSVN